MRQVAKFEQKIGERLYELYCDPQSPIPELKEALGNMMAEVFNIEKAIKDAMAQETAKKEELEKVVVVPEILES